MSDSVRPPSTVESVLQLLATQSATGCLLVRDPEGDEAQVYLREGGIYAVNVPGRRAMLGVRLVSSGALTSEALSEALEIQRTELEGWRLGELLIHLGYVEPAVVEASVVDHMTDALADLVGRPMAAWRFRKRKKTRQDTGPRTAVSELFDDLRERAQAWENILDILGSTDVAPTVVPQAAGAAQLEANEGSLLAKADGRRTVTDLAGDCGFTLFEAGQVVVRLLHAGFLQVPVTQRDTVRADALDDDLAVMAEAERRAAADRDRAEAERKAEARRKAEAKNRAELERQKVAADQRRAEAKRAEALEMQRLAAERKREQAERIRAAAAERDAIAARQRELIEAKRLADAELLNNELQALAAKDAADRAAAAEAARQAEEAARRQAAEAAQRAAAERQAAQEAVRQAHEAATRRAAEEVARIAQAAAERSVREEAERIAREDAEQRERARVAAEAEEAHQRMQEADRREAESRSISAQASGLLTQLSQEAGDLGPRVPAQAGSLAPMANLAGNPPAMAEPDQSAAAAQTDTAMLLRELSSLNFGLDDNRPTAPAAPAAPRPLDRAAAPPPVADPKSKKRKGLFGRS